MVPTIMLVQIGLPPHTEPPLGRLMTGGRQNSNRDGQIGKVIGLRAQTSLCHRYFPFASATSHTMRAL
jgi:hypothetical protein